MALADASRSGRRSMYNDNVLKLGFFGQNCSSGRYITLADERWTASWEENVRAAQLADDAGLDFLLPIGRWKGYGGQTDYAGTSFETITWATGLLAATKRINVFGTVHVPLFHPLIAGKQMVTADHVGHGRFGLNIVAGWNEDEFGMFGIEQRDHSGRYEQAQEWIDVMKRIWTEDDFDFDGKFYELKGVREKPKPFDGTQPLIMNAALSEDGRAFALRNCDALFTAASYGFDDDSLRRAEAEVKQLKEAARAIGREIDVYTNGTLLCRPTRQEALDYHQHLCVELADWDAVDNMLRMRGRLKDVPPEQHDAMRKRYATTSGGFTCIGSPDDVVGHLQTISSLGFAGIGLTSPHYANEFHYYPEEILPRLERKGLRHAR
ncbi:MAG TPA: LLM class flavin-dependent oxidoreductase [Candidatus Acidoferrales bacterium]|nr:LLM class flavin-dependent oxidoreductase [Candidatus Acidoferrales bacterium]